MESATIECKLCGMKMRVGQNMAQVHKHNEKAHDIFYNKELCLSLSLLTDEEIQTLIQKVNPRVEQLDSVGIVTDQKNIFEEVENRHEASRGDIDDIQSLLQDDNSEDDSDDDDIAEESEPKAIEYVTPQIKPSSVKVKRLSEFEINKSTNSMKEKSTNEVKDDSKNAAAQMILSWLDDSDSDSDDKSSSLVTELESLLEENPLKKRKLEEVINEDHEDSDIWSNKKLKVSMTKRAAVKTGKKGKKAENNKIDDFISSLQSQRQVGRK